METVVQPSADAELHLLTDWGDADASGRHKRALVGTVLVHAVVIAAMIAVPPILVEPERQDGPAPHITLLQPTELTQKAPNKGPISKEFEARVSLPRRALPNPPAPPPQPTAKTPRPAVIPQAAPPKPAAPAQPLPEPPKMDTAIKEPPRTDLPAIAQNAPVPPPPQIQPVEKPKLSLDAVAPPAASPGRPSPTSNPATGIADTVRDIARGGGIPGIIGDAGASDSGYGSITQRPTPGIPLANVELKSDAQGADFRPYLIRLIQTVKRNWMAVMPQSVKLGRRGKVVIQFRIWRDGHSDKAVYAQNSGSEALDHAAIAGISASNPFQPLPPEFKGQSIVLQLNFVYR